VLEDDSIDVDFGAHAGVWNVLVSVYLSTLPYS